MSEGAGEEELLVFIQMLDHVERADESNLCSKESSKMSPWISVPRNCSRANL